MFLFSRFRIELVKSFSTLNELFNNSESSANFSYIILWVDREFWAGLNILSGFINKLYYSVFKAHAI